MTENNPREIAVHLTHCSGGTCKYGEDDTCPHVTQYEPPITENTPVVSEEAGQKLISAIQGMTDRTEELSMWDGVLALTSALPHAKTVEQVREEFLETPSQQWSRMMSDDVVERAASAIREHVEPSHPDTIDIIIGVDDAAKAVLAALKPGDRVGDGCVVVPVELVDAARVIMTRYKEGGWFYDTATLEEQLKETDALDDALAALDTGETERVSAEVITSDHQR